MKIAYADPPYPGMARKHYVDHPDYGGEVDHWELLTRLDTAYDGWILHTSSTGLGHVLTVCAGLDLKPRVMAWVKPWCAFKRNVSVAYAWEPVLVMAARKPVVTGEMVMRDWFSEGMTMRKGLTGAKPPRVCEWLFHMVGAQPDDELVDLYPGTGVVARTWDAWRNRLFAAVAT